MKSEIHRRLEHSQLRRRLRFSTMPETLSYHRRSQPQRPLSMPMLVLATSIFLYFLSPLFYLLSHAGLSSGWSLILGALIGSTVGVFAGRL